MNMKSRIHLFEEDSKILETIATRYGEASPEYATLKRAGIALWYALTEGHERFKDYLEKFEGDLTPAQRLHLREMGIDPGSG
jgi:hypothetical protein